MSEVEVRNNPAEHRYEAWLDGRLLATTTYRLGDGQIVFEHTKVFEQPWPHSVGSALIYGAMDNVWDDGSLTVVPRCPFVAEWIKWHFTYQHLLRPPVRWYGERGFTQAAAEVIAPYIHYRFRDKRIAYFKGITGEVADRLANALPPDNLRDREREADLLRVARDPRVSIGGEYVMPNRPDERITVGILWIKCADEESGVAILKELGIDVEDVEYETYEHDYLVDEGRLKIWWS
jgi:hypothetical protein